MYLGIKSSCWSPVFSRSPGRTGWSVLRKQKVQPEFRWEEKMFEIFWRTELEAVRYESVWCYWFCGGWLLVSHQAQLEPRNKQVQNLLRNIFHPKFKQFQYNHNLWTNPKKPTTKSWGSSKNSSLGENHVEWGVWVHKWELLCWTQRGHDTFHQPEINSKHQHLVWSQTDRQTTIHISQT